MFPLQSFTLQAPWPRYKIQILSPPCLLLAPMVLDFLWTFTMPIHVWHSTSSQYPLHFRQHLLLLNLIQRSLLPQFQTLFLGFPLVLVRQRTKFQISSVCKRQPTKSWQSLSHLSCLTSAILLEIVNYQQLYRSFQWITQAKHAWTMPSLILHF